MREPQRTSSHRHRSAAPRNRAGSGDLGDLAACEVSSEELADHLHAAYTAVKNVFGDRIAERLAPFERIVRASMADIGTGPLVALAAFLADVEECGAGLTELERVLMAAAAVRITLEEARG